MPTEKHITKERWRLIPDSGGLYSASTSGRIRREPPLDGRSAPGGILKSSTSARYPRVLLYRNGRRKSASVHALVAATFLGSCPPGKQVNHKDGDKRNPALYNLEYATPLENAQHASRMGLLPRGENHPLRLRPERAAHGEQIASSKLTEAMVRKIFDMDRRQVPKWAIAAELRVTRVTIYRALRGLTWKHMQYLSR